MVHLPMLDEEEQREVSAVLEDWSAKSRQHITLNGLVMDWAKFVRMVEVGYADSIYEYTNDLTVRDVLENVFVSVCESAGMKIRKALVPWDERFEKATRMVGTPLLSADPKYVWWFRVPLILKGELKDDLQAEGLG